VLSRDAAIPVLRTITCAPITRTIRGIAPEVQVGAPEGLPTDAVVSCDHVMTIPQSRLDARTLGRIEGAKRVELDRALRYALDIAY
jgi:mRNA interferase MazF